MVVLESTKAAVDSYAPITGEVIAINHELLENPHLINTEPETSGWLYVLRVHE